MVAKLWLDELLSIAFQSYPFVRPKGSCPRCAGVVGNKLEDDGLVVIEARPLSSPLFRSKKVVIFFNVGLREGDSEWPRSDQIVSSIWWPTSQFRSRSVLRVHWSDVTWRM